MAPEYWAAHDLPDFEEGKGSSAEVCSCTERGQTGDKSDAARAGKEGIFAPLPSMLMMPCKTQPSSKLRVPLSILGGKKGMGSRLGGLS